MRQPTWFCTECSLRCLLSKESCLTLGSIPDPDFSGAWKRDVAFGSRNRRLERGAGEYGNGGIVDAG